MYFVLHLHGLHDHHHFALAYGIAFLLDQLEDQTGQRRGNLGSVAARRRGCTTALVDAGFDIDGIALTIDDGFVPFEFDLEGFVVEGNRITAGRRCSV